MEHTFIGLGGNMGEVKVNFEKAIGKIEELIGPVIRKSSLYKTEPWGRKDQDPFLNMVIEVATPLSAEQTLFHLLSIEKSLGRLRDSSNQYGPRSIDMDILFFGEQIVNNGHLVIPHPKLHQRNFVLIPMAEISPEFCHPVLHKKISELLLESSDEAQVTSA